MRLDVPKLEIARFGTYAFTDTDTLTMDDIPLLESLELGNYCFRKGTTLVLSSKEYEEYIGYRSSKYEENHNGELLFL